jgi:hemerythrin-like metal-binding protein
MRSLFARSWLLGENISVPVMNQLVRATSSMIVEPGQVIDEDKDALFLIREGSAERRVEGKTSEVLKACDFFGEAMVLHGHRPVGSVITLKETEIITIPGAMLRHIPIVRWKLFETHLKRLRHLLTPIGEGSAFPWNSDYGVGVQAMDRHHQKLFDLANRIMAAIDRNDPRHVLDLLTEMIQYNNYHFDEEIKLLETVSLIDVEAHRLNHDSISAALEQMHRRFDFCEEGEMPIGRGEFQGFFQDLVIDHIFKEDRKFARYLFN